MPAEMQGRRLRIVNFGTVPEPMVGQLPDLSIFAAGDYCGPLLGYTGDKPAVFFLLPVARDPGTSGGARSLHHVTSPPHVFHEEPDGSLTIRESIGANPYWHGFLNQGRWELQRKP